MPKELISRFVKLCPTCQVRRGNNRNSPHESDRSPEELTDPQSPEIPSTPASRKNSSGPKSTTMSMSLPLQTAGFATSSTFEQQNRWMTPLSPQDITLSRPTRLIANSNMNSQAGYNTLPPMPMSCTSTTSPSLSYSTAHAFSNGPNPAAYNLDAVSRVSHGAVPTTYGVKVEQSYM